MSDKARRKPKFYGRAVPIDGPRATITPEQRDSYKRDVRVITGRDVDVYKPTTELLRTLYGHLGRTGYYVPQDELDGRCAAFNRWLGSVQRAAWKEGHADGLCDGAAYEDYQRDGTRFIPTPNPYGEETP